MGHYQHEDAAYEEQPAPDNVWLCNCPFAYLNQDCSNDIGSAEDNETIADIIGNEEGSFFQFGGCFFRWTDRHCQYNESYCIGHKGDEEHDIVDIAEMRLVAIKVVTEVILVLRKGWGEVEVVIAKNVLESWKRLEVQCYLLVV